MEHQLVIFELANEHYGVNIAMVEGIIKMQLITAVPHAPSFVEGVTNLRGAVLPVIDLRKRFNLPPEETTKHSRIIHIVIDNVRVGMIVDAVSEVLRVSEEAIEPTPPIVTTVDSAFITGIAKLEDKLIILLDLGKVLSFNEQEKLLALSMAA
ncbi:MAG: chemotaxis protein CheW [Anaerolineales bacterium]|nr:chemotaxis protein CheW [Anaerolineales bacterium]